MIDTNQLLINFMLVPANPVRAALGADNVFGVVLPEGFDVRTGAKAVVVAVRGGDAHAEIVGWKTERVQVTCWAVTPLEARKVYAAVFDYLQATSNATRSEGFLVSALEVVSGQDVVDPDTGWATCVGFFNVTVRP